MDREIEYCPGDDADGVKLDQNHSYFILVDDGSNGKYGAEINFRAELENELQLGKTLSYYEEQKHLKSPESINMNETSLNEKIPMILIVVQGGPRTLQTVVESIDKDVPVLVLAVSLIL